MRQRTPWQMVYQAARKLAARPRRPIHPLRVFLLERDITIEELAGALNYRPGMGMSVRKIKSVIAKWELPYSGEDEKRAKVAAALGFEDWREIFPDGMPE